MKDKNYIKPSFIKRIKIFWQINKIKILIWIADIILLIGTFYGFKTIYPFYKKMTLVNIPLQLILTTLNLVIFLFFYLKVFRNGFGEIKKKLYKKRFYQYKIKDIVD